MAAVCPMPMPPQEDSLQRPSQAQMPIRESPIAQAPRHAPSEQRHYRNLSPVAAKTQSHQFALTWSRLGRTHRGIVVFGGRSDWRVLFGGGIDSRDCFSFTVCYGDWSLLSQDVGQSPKQGGDDTVRFTKQVCMATKGL